MTVSSRIVGFSTIDKSPGDTNYVLYDIELAIRDLLNTFKTPKGSRVMLPLFGSMIYSYVFENFNDAMSDDIKNDVMNVVNSDPRFSYNNCTVSNTDNEITVDMNLKYLPSEINFNLSVLFDNNTQDIS